MRTLPAVLLLGVLTHSLSAQIPPRKTLASSSGTPKVLVATPEIADGVDRAKAVDLAQGFRDRVSETLGGRFAVVSRDALNRVLASSGYDADAPLSEAAARALGTQMQAALVFSGAVRQEADGRLTVSGSLASPKEASPAKVTLTQAEGQDAAALGAALAEQLKKDAH